MGMDLITITAIEEEARGAPAPVSIEHPPVALLGRKHSDPRIAAEIRDKLINKYTTIPTSPGGGHDLTTNNLDSKRIDNASRGSGTGSVEGSDESDNGPGLTRQPRLADKMLFDGELTDYNTNFGQQDIAGKQDT